ncbi:MULTISPECIES: CopD family protein [unclassified Pseudomonas]|uniref:CopD family protein n=1 Tax=unclassified Pseudomonas TaxID=196821 RepID=UPI000DAC0EA6|nr:MULTISPECIES: CopD family protein [unclassified Pseudomonas]PZW39493.1 putative membrane protein [Pseudomonas sp. URMO17WK12:I2]
MPLLKLLHFTALIAWCGTLLYLPALIAASCRSPQRAERPGHPQLNRTVFNLIATPAAIVAIGSGTALFLRDGTFGIWLVAKLTAVAVMVICHALCGLLILQCERQPRPALTIVCAALGGITLGMIAATLWLVLAKPY